MSKGTTGSTEAPDVAVTVMVVDDEPGLVEVYAHALTKEFDVLTATSGEEALDEIDDGVDVVFLDRRMPDFSGDEVLEQIHDQGLDPRVVMVTAVEPDFDIVGMPFDAYLVKPVTGQDLRESAFRMLERDQYADTVQNYYALAEKKAALEARKSPVELEESEEYQALLDEMQQAREAADQQLGSLSSGEFDEAFRDL